MSIRSRTINLVLRALRRSGVMVPPSGPPSDPELVARALHRIRSTDQPEPHRRLRRRRRHERLQLPHGPLHLLGGRVGPSARVVYYLHGGGYLFGPGRVHWAAMDQFTRDVGADLAMPVYPVAPEHPHHDTRACALEGYELVCRRYGPESVVVAGDSAGGGLSVSLLTALRDAGLPQPHAAVLISPWLDLTMSNPSLAAQIATDLMLSVEGARFAAALYAGDTDPADPRLSPMFASLDGLAPMHVFVGTDELFLADCRDFVAKARANGNTATLREMRGGQHVAALFPTPEGRVARGQMAALIDWP